MELRNYQSDLIESVRAELRAGFRRLCVVSPTGSGKTQCFCFMAGRATGRVWIVVHRRELARQTSKTLTAWGVPHGVISAGEAYDGQRVQVCSVDTLATRIKSGAEPIDAPDILIVDECDLAEAATWQRVIQKYSAAILIGFTATPQRLDGKGLGSTYQRLIMGPSVPFLMDAGHLARPVYYGVPNVPDMSGIGKERGDFNRAELAKAVEDSPVLTGDIVEHYHRIAPGSRYVGFAVSIKQAERLASDFNAKGYPSAAMSAKSKDRDELMARLRSGDLCGLFSVDILGRGTDVPAIETVILARPTMSLALHIQQVGRGLRPCEGKVKRVIDHAGNIQRHGLAETVRQFSLDGVHAKTRTKEMLEAVRQCGTCYGWSAPTPCCPQCGAVLPLKPRVTKEQAGHLRKLTPEEVEAAMLAKKASVAERKACRTFGELVALARRTGKNLYWATKVWRGRQR